MTSLYRRTRARLQPLRRGWAHFSVQLRHGWIPAVQAQLRRWWWRRHRLIPVVRGQLRPWRLRAKKIAARLGRLGGFDPDQPIVFLHIPKTSGIAFAHGLIDAVPPRGEFFGFDRASYSSLRDFGSIEPETRATIHLTPDTIPRDRGFVRAHAAYSTLAASYGHGQFITVLREPRARILSHWLFWRGFSDAQMAPWGEWADRMRLSQGSLAGFLSAPDLGCQLDNYSTRLLLWPHPLIPDVGFIDPAHDAALLAEARARLRQFQFVDVVENPAMANNVSRWLRRDFHYGRANETPTMPIHLRGNLQTEMAQAGTLLDQRARLDREIWRDVAAKRGVAKATLDDAATKSIARFSALLKG